MSPKEACKFTDSRLQDPDFSKALEKIACSAAGSILYTKFHCDGTVREDWKDQNQEPQFGLSRSIEYHIIKLCPKYAPLLVSEEEQNRMNSSGVYFHPAREEKVKGRLYIHGEAGLPGCSTYGLHLYTKEKSKKVKGEKVSGERRVKTNKLANANKYVEGFKPELTIDAALEHALASGEFWVYRLEFLDGIETVCNMPLLYERVRLFFLRSMIVAITKDEDIEISNSGMHQRVENVSLANRLADPLLRYRPSGVADRLRFNIQSWGHLKI